MSSRLTYHVALVSDTPHLSFRHVASVAAALQKQVSRDFGPLWGVNATVDAFETLEDIPVDYWPVIIRDDIDEPGAAGYHTDDNGQPFSLVQLDSGWGLTASHETLEMLADPFGSRTVAGSPPPQAPKPVSDFARVLYLVEVCDPCEEIAYKANGIRVSDFITPHYYDPDEGTGTRYSFRGHVKAPHTVLDGGYVSFGNPVTNHWYQIIVQNGKVHLEDLGVIKSARGKSLREMIDHIVRGRRVDERYRLKPAAAAAAAALSGTPFAETSAARAQSLREYVKGLK